MQIRNMRGVNLALYVLRVVVVLNAFVGVDVVKRDLRELQLGHFGREFLWSHICPDHAATFLRGVASSLNLLLKITIRRLRWHVEALTIYVKHPSVIHAPEPVVFITAPEEVRPPVRAKCIE
jgi:hypothetical protein